MLEIEPDLQYSLLEFVAHLTSEDYSELPEDLARLGFLKKEKLDFARRSGVLEPLKYFLRQAGKGGGASGVRSRIFDEYREKYAGLTDDELRVEMRAEMKVRQCRASVLVTSGHLFSPLSLLFSAKRCRCRGAGKRCYWSYHGSGRASKEEQGLV